MAHFSEPSWIQPVSHNSETLHELARSLGLRPADPLGALSKQQNHAILAVGVTCASVSLLAALATFQWFAFMKRNFRHHLIFLLIVSDLWKALWYFIFPIVVFTKGEVDSTSGFCQASGFFLALGTEASDFAILMIALHVALYVLRPPDRLGEGGLYSYRYWMYALWVILPVLEASLAYTNPEGYITSGTYCALPKRPFWYRLGLSYMPRYIIFIAIFALYGTITLYVHIKFKGFSQFNEHGSLSGTGSQNSTSGSNTQESRFTSISQNVDSRKQSVVASAQDPGFSNRDPFHDTRPEWEVNFIAAAPPKEVANRRHGGIAIADFAPGPFDSSCSTQVTMRNLVIRSLQGHDDTALSSARQRKDSEAPTLGTESTGETRVSNTTTQIFPTTSTVTTNQPQDTRDAILRQLRLLFVYPAVYLLMWIFPFINQCLQYDDYLAAHPPFWLSVVATCSLALQAGADCVVFSWREKPWRRVTRNGGRGRVAKEYLRRMSAWTLGRGAGAKNAAGAGSGMAGVESPFELDSQEGHSRRRRQRDSHWWEEEGKKRKDSVWLGTDAINQHISQQEEEENRRMDETAMR